VLNATFVQYYSYIVATSFSGGGSQSTRREPPTMGKQLVNFITCGYESSAFFVIYQAGANPRFILLSSFNITIWRSRGGLDRMLVEFTTTHAISAYPTDIESSNPAQAKCTTLCDKVCH
jgi:hypothetical protein